MPYQSEGKVKAKAAVVLRYNCKYDFQKGHHADIPSAGDVHQPFALRSGRRPLSGLPQLAVLLLLI